MTKAPLSVSRGASVAGAVLRLRRRSRGLLGRWLARLRLLSLRLLSGLRLLTGGC